MRIASLHPSLTIAIAVITTLPLASPAVYADPERTAKYRQAFLSATTSPTSDPAEYKIQRRQLDGYVLAPYLDYRYLQRTLRTLDADTARDFLADEATTQLGQQFRREYLSELARRGDWTTFLSFDKGSANIILRCHRTQALLVTGRDDDARHELLQLWPTAQSLPDACDNPIATARSRGWLGSELVWQRLRLAVNANNSGLAAYLARLLPADERTDAERLIQALSNPEATLKVAAHWPDRPRYREVAALALRRRARASIDSALVYWPSIESHFSFTADEHTTIVHDLALYAAVAYRADAEDWFERVPIAARDEALVEWQLRAALAALDWPSVLKIVAGLPEALAAAPRPRYWHARALSEVQRKTEAKTVYAALATEANFHGFLAADQLSLPYAICPSEVTADPARGASLREAVDVARALELHAVGWRIEATRAWDQAREQLDEADRLQLLLLASAQGWHDRVIFALNTGDDMRQYALRFPLAERKTVEREAVLNKLNPAWTYALIRAESAWQADVRSPANAYGLMQLLPATGQRMARQLGIGWRGTSTLLDPQTNIRLGTRYLAQQADEFQGSPWLASAAYNAGPGAVRRWLSERSSLPADIFIETIPYRETREYVSRVLAFTVIYDWRLNGETQSLSSRLPDPGRPYAGGHASRSVRSVACPGAAATPAA